VMRVHPLVRFLEMDEKELFFLRLIEKIPILSCFNFILFSTIFHNINHKPNQPKKISKKQTMKELSWMCLIVVFLVFLCNPVWTLDEKEKGGLVSLIFNLDGLPSDWQTGDVDNA